MTDRLAIPSDEHPGVQSPDMSDSLVRLNNLKVLMRDRGWSQSDLGKHVGRSRTQVNNWLQGERSIGERIARSIEEKLGLPRYSLDDRPGQTAHTRAIFTTAPGKAPLKVGESPQRWSVTTAHKVFPVVSWEAATRTMSAVPNERSAALPTLTSYTLAANDRSVFLIVRDDAMAPTFNVGDHILVDPEAPVRAGDAALMELPTGELLLRSYRPRTTATFEAAPENAAYATLNSSSDGVRLLGRVVEHRRYLG